MPIKRIDFRDDFVSMVMDKIKRWMEETDQYDIKSIVINKHVMVGSGTHEVWYKALVYYQEES